MSADGVQTAPPVIELAPITHDSFPNDGREQSPANC
jgi:hypothetical protein